MVGNIPQPGDALMDERIALLGIGHCSTSSTNIARFSLTLNPNAEYERSVERTELLRRGAMSINELREQEGLLMVGGLRVNPDDTTLLNLPGIRSRAPWPNPDTHPHQCSRQTLRRYTLAPATPWLWWLSIVLAALIAVAWFAPASFGQPAPATQPVTIPVLAWNQPARNLPAMAAMGVTTVLGAEVENGRNLAPDALAAGKLAWIKASQDAGLSCILKAPTGPLPVNCVGIILSIDEPNGKLIPPAAMLGERDDLRARYPGVPILLSLAGDKVTSANFRAADQVKLYQDYAALADVLTVDVYSFNRDATRYKPTWTADAVKTLKAVTGKPVIAWAEANDQQLKPIGGANRAPTPAEIKETVDAAVAAGASGIGWFFTCDSGKYGWPQSYLPQVDRNGASMRPQYDAVRSISISLAGPPVTPAPVVVTPLEVLALQARIAALEQNDGARSAQIDALTARANELQAARAAQDAKINAAAKALAGNP